MNGKTLCPTCDDHTCTTHNNPNLIEQTDNYWDMPNGIRRRIQQLSQDFTYRVVNGAIKIYGQTNGATWLYWLTVGDDRVCPICTKAAQGGRDGHYRVTWFTPAMPAHPGCRCQWIVYFKIE